MCHLLRLDASTKTCPDGSIPYFKVIKELDDLDSPSWMREKIREGYFQSVVQIGITQPHRIDDDVISAISTLETVEEISMEFHPSDENSLTESQVVELKDRIEQECGVEVFLDRKVSLE